VTLRPERIWGEALFAGTLAQLIAALTGLPSVVPLLALGLPCGRAGLNLVVAAGLGDGLEPVPLLVSLNQPSPALSLQRGCRASMILLTVGLQGLSAPVLARRLQLVETDATPAET
jgi:NhaP-type Na+/H+ or K+/H+ antiporter